MLSLLCVVINQRYRVSLLRSSVRNSAHRYDPISASFNSTRGSPGKVVVVTGVIDRGNILESSIFRS